MNLSIEILALYQHPQIALVWNTRGLVDNGRCGRYLLGSAA